MSTGAAGRGIRVVMTAASLIPEAGGPSQTIPALARALAVEGCDVDLVSVEMGPRFGRPLWTDVPGARLTLLPRRLSWGTRIVCVPGLDRTLRSLGAGVAPCVLHDNGVWLPTNHAASRVAEKTGWPLVVSPHGALLSWSFRHRAVRKRIAWWLYQRKDLTRARVLHATAEDEARALRSLGFRQPIAVVPSGVDVPRLATPDRAPKTRRTVLFLSRIHPKKGLLNLVHAWFALRPAGWRVVVVGPDFSGFRAEVEDTVRRGGMDADFEFLGPVDEPTKWRLYQGADLFVLPTHSENFGVVIAEALGCAVPVITTRGTPWGEIVSRRCGWWIDVGVPPLIEALREAMALSDDERREMGARGRTWVEARFAWRAIALEMASIYEWLLRRASRPACVVD